MKEEIDVPTIIIDCILKERIKAKKEVFDDLDKMTYPLGIHNIIDLKKKHLGEKQKVFK